MAQQEITPETLFKIKQGYNSNDPATIALTNALTNNDVKKLTVNRENEGKVDSYFKYKVKIKGITDQKSSGRCWMFTSLNVFRPAVMDKLHISSFEFSENYLYFYDILEKANLFLENTMATAAKPIDDRLVDWYFKSPIDDGGVWNSFVNLVKKYGLVPKEAMARAVGYSKHTVFTYTSYPVKVTTDYALGLIKNKGVGEELSHGLH